MYVALRSSGARPADVCFSDCDSATRPALVYPPRVVRRRRRLLAAAGCEPEHALRCSRVAGVPPREAGVLRHRRQLRLRRPLHHRGDATVSSAPRDEWSSSDPRATVAIDEVPATPGTRQSRPTWEAQERDSHVRHGRPVRLVEREHRRCRVTCCPLPEHQQGRRYGGSRKHLAEQRSGLDRRRGQLVPSS